MHVVARCNNREFYFAAPEDFEILLDLLGEMGSAYGVRLFAYTWSILRHMPGRVARAMPWGQQNVSSSSIQATWD